MALRNTYVLTAPVPFKLHRNTPSSNEEEIKGWWLECKEFLPSDPEYDIFMIRKIPNQP
jgi:hypothetical protein